VEKCAKTRWQNTVQKVSKDQMGFLGKRGRGGEKCKVKVRELLEESKRKEKDF
jgi:hypothetical protein